MTCRHVPGDPNCSKSGGGVDAEVRRQQEQELTATKAKLDQYEKAFGKEPPTTPDSRNFSILDAEEFATSTGTHLALRVQYPNCARCSYEGVKVMVFAKTGLKDALRWREIDPHFRNPKTLRAQHQAPGPVARFPGSDAGWTHAKAYIEDVLGVLLWDEE